METYTTMRLLADSWGLLAMTAFFIGAVIFAFRPGSRAIADDAAQIPFKDDRHE
ncbi:MAG: cbb3-type cytochrome c oxidase subunit 3 [Afipia sp.]|nr:cbb3-type cytochrome c oxidase subunit 3 [Afipia sp.]